jgi:hypothetical protein
LSRSKLLPMVLSLCLVLVMLYLTVDYFKGQQAKNRQVTEINTATQTLQVLPDPAQNLAERLGQAKADNQAAKQSLSGQDIDSTAVIALLLKTADDRHLKVDPISSEQWSKKSFGTSIYRMLPIELTISGSPADFYFFIADLENQQLFPSLVIEELSITRSNPDGPEAEAGFRVKLSLSLAVRLEVTG